MRTLKTTSDAYIRQCRVCKKKEILPRYQGSTKNILLRNSFRARHGADLTTKDLLQPYQGGKPNPAFAKEYPEKAAGQYTQKELKKLGMEKIKSKKK